MKHELVNIRQFKDNVNSDLIRNEIKILMNDHAGIERNEKDMTMALNQINEYIEQLENGSLESEKP